MTPLAFLRLITIAAVLAPGNGFGGRECRDDLNEEDGYTIRSVVVEGRWAPRIDLPIKPGDRYSNAKVQQALRAVQQALRGDARRGFELQNLGALGVVHITRCLRVDGRAIDLIIQPRSLRVDLFEVGGSVLPIPRAPFATFYDSVPALLLALNPALGAYQDKEYGFAPTLGISALLFERAPVAGASSRLELSADGRKSVEHSFYDADAAIGFATVRPGEFFERLSFDARYAGKKEPRAERRYERQAGELGGNLRLKAKCGVIETVAAGAKYRWSDNRFDSDNQGFNTSEHAAELRLLAEGRTGGGFLRAGLWADAGFPDRAGNYGRVAGLLGFEKEILVGPNQTIGFEAILGAGKAWSAPAYAEFYGGNSRRDFLYERLESPALAAFPVGPIIRSFGEGQALSRSGGRGSSSYWQLNLNVSLPIPALSRPLIPDEEVAPGVSLKRLLKNKASDSIAFYAIELEEQGFTPAAALAKARATYGEVRPAIEFIADRANVYSVKPLLLCDLAGQDEGSGDHRVQAAIGGGLQLTIVTAKMEIGYMHTVAGGRDKSGNLFGRIVFQNLF